MHALLKQRNPTPPFQIIRQAFPPGWRPFFLFFKETTFPVYFSLPRLLSYRMQLVFVVLRVVAKVSVGGGGGGGGGAALEQYLDRRGLHYLIVSAREFRRVDKPPPPRTVSLDLALSSPQHHVCPPRGHALAPHRRRLGRQ